MGFVTGVSLLLLWIFYTVFYRQFCVDRHRAELFEIRNRLFDRAAAGEISFDNKGYQLARYTLNAFIRHAHKSCLADFLMTLASHKRMPDSVKDSFRQRLSESLEGCTEEEKEIINGVFEELHARYVVLIVKTSPIALPVFLSYVVFSSVWKPIKEIAFRNLKKLSNPSSKGSASAALLYVDEQIYSESGNDVSRERFPRAVA
mmetsp:Transcript_25499/g.74354  ORF Transcript_25499/g.74354 Transcript_25499/m.74354 type:complete len:203 (-) Transcript_25499:29-637(-)|eukprot:CAMPEP_0118969988 /NCGR_PEP_ID=MMETSP1173-20130426/6989_1 /TAXON_ID=1034831 /ORGANISM="Rhizochromulina marina cf, Strain CCMP1243" /LENGTH=202 /DNA_ID=CAMNT_0006919293 /DNA_START=128 /DNA_END=736 /DNA_ORIENTATION=-